MNLPCPLAFSVTNSFLLPAAIRTTSCPGHPNQSPLPFSCFPVLMFSCQKLPAKGQFFSTQKAQARLVAG
jgi:hypothetical protein